MPVNSTLGTTRAIVFVKLELSGTTLRYANENIIATDTDGIDYFWEGRVVSVSDMSAGFNDYREASSTVTNLQIVLANGIEYSGGSNIDSNISSYFWGLQTCTVFLQRETTTHIASGAVSAAWKVGVGQHAGPGKMIGDRLSSVTSTKYALSTSEVIIKGIVSFPNVFTRHDDKTVQFTVFDQRYSDQFLAAPNVFKLGQVTDSTTFAALGENVEGKSVPVVYGDWTDSCQIPAYVVGGGIYGSNVSFKAADSSILAAGQSALTAISGASIAGIFVYVTTTDLANGNFTISNPFLYENQEVKIVCSGKTRGTAIAALFGGSAATLLEHPVEVLYDLLVNRLAVSSTFVDTAGFTTLYNVDTSLKCRRWLGSSETIVSEINSLCFEFGFQLYEVFGTFRLKQLGLSGSSEITLTQDDLDPDTYQLQTDPNRSYFNALSLRYLLDMNSTGDGFQRVLRIKNDSKIAQHGKTQDLVLDMHWNYKELTVVETFGLLLYFFSKPIRYISATFRTTAWNLEPNDIFAFTFHIFTAQNFLVRWVGKSLRDFSTQVKGWDLGTLRLKTWAANADSTPAAYSDAVAATYTVWHADSTITTGFNDTFSFKTDAVYLATITAGSYGTAALLATAIQTAMNVVAVSSPVTVSYSTSTRKFTITRVSGGTLELYFLTTAEIGRGVLGFSAAANKTGSTGYTSDNVAIFDLSEGEAASQWV